jgi:hypothetical protein
MELKLNGLRNRGLIAASAVLALVAWTTGCRVHVEKGANGRTRTSRLTRRLAASM